MNLPTLQTERLQIRPFTLDDLTTYHRINVAAGWTDETMTAEANLQARRKWLEWTVRNYEQLARLHQTPYGDRAIVLKDGDQLIGGCGLVSLLMPFGQLPSFGGRAKSLYSTEMGLFWIIDPAYQGQGYATEAAEALVRYAFDDLFLHRLLATTEYSNLASARVMRRLGMTIERNPFPDPPWMQRAWATPSLCVALGLLGGTAQWLGNNRRDAFISSGLMVAIGAVFALGDARRRSACCGATGGMSGGRCSTCGRLRSPAW